MDKSNTKRNSQINKIKQQEQNKGNGLYILCLELKKQIEQRDDQIKQKENQIEEKQLKIIQIEQELHDTKYVNEQNLFRTKDIDSLESRNNYLQEKLKRYKEENVKLKETIDEFEKNLTQIRMKLESREEYQNYQQIIQENQSLIENQDQKIKELEKIQQEQKNQIQIQNENLSKSTKELNQCQEIVESFLEDFGKAKKSLKINFDLNEEFENLLKNNKKVNIGKNLEILLKELEKQFKWRIQQENEEKDFKEFTFKQKENYQQQLKELEDQVQSYKQIIEQKNNEESLGKELDYNQIIQQKFIEQKYQEEISQQKFEIMSLKNLIEKWIQLEPIQDFKEQIESIYQNCIQIIQAMREKSFIEQNLNDIEYNIKNSLKQNTVTEKETLNERFQLQLMLKESDINQNSEEKKNKFLGKKIENTICFSVGDGEALPKTRSFPLALDFGAPKKQQQNQNLLQQNINNDQQKKRNKENMNQQQLGKLKDSHGSLTTQKNDVIKKGNVDEMVRENNKKYLREKEKEEEEKRQQQQKLREQKEKIKEQDREARERNLRKMEQNRLKQEKLERERIQKEKEKQQKEQEKQKVLDKDTAFSMAQSVLNNREKNQKGSGQKNVLKNNSCATFSQSQNGNNQDLIDYFKKEYEKNVQELHQINKLCGQDTKNPDLFRIQTEQRAKKALEEMRKKKEEKEQQFITKKAKILEIQEKAKIQRLKSQPQQNQINSEESENLSQEQNPNQMFPDFDLDEQEFLNQKKNKKNSKKTNNRKNRSRSNSKTKQNSQKQNQNSKAFIQSEKDVQKKKKNFNFKEDFDLDEFEKIEAELDKIPMKLNIKKEDLGYLDEELKKIKKNAILKLNPQLLQKKTEQMQNQNQRKNQKKSPKNEKRITSKSVDNKKKYDEMMPLLLGLQEKLLNDIKEQDGLYKEKFQEDLSSFSEDEQERLFVETTNLKNKYGINRSDSCKFLNSDYENKGYSSVKGILKSNRSFARSKSVRFEESFDQNNEDFQENKHSQKSSNPYLKIAVLVERQKHNDESLRSDKKWGIYKSSGEKRKQLSCSSNSKESVLSPQTKNSIQFNGDEFQQYFDPEFDKIFTLDTEDLLNLQQIDI